MTKIRTPKQPNGTVAIIGGIIAILLGIISFFVGNLRWMAYLCILLCMLVNLFVHGESYLRNLWAGRRQDNVLTITISEAVIVLLMILEGARMLKQPDGISWNMLLAIFAAYLIFNGASLLTFPVNVAKVSGCIAIISAILVYFSIGMGGVFSAVIIGSSMIINGVERLVMSLMARAVRRKASQ